MKWASTFGYLPLDFTMEMRQAENQIQEIFFDNNIEGDRVRLRFSNRYGKTSLELARAEVSLAAEDGSGSGAGETCTVTRDGSLRITLKPGEECWSDELALPVAAGDRICIRTWVEERQFVGSFCMFWSQTGPKVRLWEAGKAGERSGRALSFSEAYPDVLGDELLKAASHFYGIIGMQVWTGDKAKTVAMFGDSITQMSYFSNALTRRLYSAYPGQVAVVNRGIGGNRLLRDAIKAPGFPGDGSIFGDAGIRRFERDVLGGEPADIVLVLEGINDIMHPAQFEDLGEKVTAEELISGYEKLIHRARRQGIPIFGGTLPPCGQESYCEAWMEEFEEIRQGVNSWIRTSESFDGWTDYDAALRKEENPSFMRKEYHLGDGLHPNDLGGKQMAEQVDLEALMRQGSLVL